MVLFLCLFFVSPAPAACNWATFSETNPNATAAIPNSFGFDQSVHLLQWRRCQYCLFFGGAFLKVFAVTEVDKHSNKK